MTRVQAASEARRRGRRGGKGEEAAAAFELRCRGGYISNRSREKPDCIMPGEAITTIGRESSKLDSAVAPPRQSRGSARA